MDFLFVSIDLLIGLLDMIEKISQLLNTKQKKVGACAILALIVLLIIALVGGVFSGGSKEFKLVFAEKGDIQVEYGMAFEPDVKEIVDFDGFSNSKINDIAKDIKVETDVVNEVATITNEDGTTTEEEREYPGIGEYSLKLTYNNESISKKVVVTDTTEPEIKAPETMDLLQFTDLSTFNFGQLLQVTDYSDVGDWMIDTSGVDVNTIGEYTLKVSIEDTAGNKAEAEIKVNVVAAPELGEGEVAVTEIVTDENGNTKTVVTKKASSSVGANDSVAQSGPVSNSGSVSSSSGSSASKPSGSNGTSGGSSSSGGNSNSSGGNSGSSGNSGNSGNNSGNSGGSNSGSSGNTGGSGGSNSGSTDEHVHNWVEQTRVVHHDAITHTEQKLVQAAYDEPVYESRYICNRCDFSTKDGSEMTMHIFESCGGGYHVGQVQVDTIHHEAVYETVTVVDKEAWDETVHTGYKCSGCGATKH